MRIRIHDDSFTIWLSASDTYNWAHEPGASWPCSTLADRRIVATFDTNGLLELAVDGRDASEDIDGHELSAMVADFANKKLDESHPCHFVAVGQFS